MGVTPFHFLTFDDKSSGEFGVWISGSGTFNAPARDVSMVSVPGRNGDLTFDNGRFQNITVTYPAFISRRFQPRVDDFRAWICSRKGYCRLEDTYHPDEYRLAIYKSGLNVTPTAYNAAGRFNLAFECKPQRFLKAGEVALPRMTAAGKVFNPTQFDALPLVRCYGTGGTVSINGVEVTVTGCSSFVDIDCDLMECYEGTTNRNGSTTLQDGEFPKLVPGVNAVSFTGFTAVVITPRFFTI